MRSAFKILLYLLLGYIPLWMTTLLAACNYVREWAIKNGLSPVNVTILMPYDTPDLGQTRKQRLCLLTVRDQSGKVRKIWVAVSPCIFGLIFAKRAEVMKVDIDEEI